MDKKRMDSDVNIKVALSPKVVGYCMDILDNYLSESNEPTLDGFKDYYINRYTTYGLDRAVNIIVSKGYSFRDAKEYVNQRVFKDTWRGKYWERRVKEEMLLKGFKMRYSTKNEDYVYNVDLIGDRFAIQVKPMSYYKGRNPSLSIDKKKHKAAHILFEDKFNIPVVFAFYDRNNNEIIYKKI